VALAKVLPLVRRVPVVLDVDTGVDDALAILFALRSPRVDLLAVTCVVGNVDVDSVVRNTLRVLEAAGAHGVPVGRGCAEPLSPGRSVHGSDGMADLGLPEPRRGPVAGHAVELLRRTLTGARRPVTLVACGPLTNVAMLLRQHPDVKPAIAGIVAAAGHGPGVQAVGVEDFNGGHDGDAVDFVSRSGVPVTAYGGELMSQVVLTPEQVRRVAPTSASPGGADAGSALARSLLEHQLARSGGGSARIGDAAAVVSVVEPNLLVTRRRPWLHGTPAQAGATVHNACDVDAGRCASIFLDALA
jgi:pyrimidine-specific ribonucleoside hydrolase